MNQKIYTFFVFFLSVFMVQSTIGQTIVTVKDSDLTNGTHIWTSDNVYILDGLVFLEEGGMLTIEAGTVIKGKKDITTGDNASALIIARGAQIFAEGTADSPIIFTAEEDDINDPDDRGALDRGLWGGLIVLGNGVIARPGGEDGIEGIDANEARAKYGGNDNGDNSGVLKYISIRHGGAALSPNNEINGLTLGGVGSKTVIEHIEVFANFDDGIEWFGGAVNGRWLAVAFCGDDGMDYDFGWRGNGQFWFVIHGEGPLEAGRGGEHDGAKPDGESPFSKPTIYNATYIGSGVDPIRPPAGDENDFAMVFRDRAGGFYGNSIFTEYPDKALNIEDLPAADGDDTYTNWQNGDLALVNNFWFGFGRDRGNGLADLVETGTAASETDIINTLVANDNKLGVDPQLAGISRNPDGQLDPRLAFGSPALGSAIEPNDDFFMNVPYNGAFGNEELWLEGWTALDQYGYLGNLISNTYEVEKEAEGYIFRLPTPVPAKTEVIASFDLPAAGNVSMLLFDLNGRMVQPVLSNQRYPQGEFNQRINVSTLPNGTYILMLQTGSVRIAHKVIVQR